MIFPDFLIDDVMELTNALCKIIQSLETMKGRKQTSLFMAEGTKCVLELLPAFELEYLIATRQWLDDNKNVSVNQDKVIEAGRGEIKKISQLTTPRDVVAVFKIPTDSVLPDNLKSELVIALDRVQDPGNFGTIIRICDWFGVHNIIASFDTVDCFNPKVVQATMGAIGRVKVHYVDNLSETIRSLSASMPIYGTFLDGENIYKAQLSGNGVIVMGNEGAGISDEVGRVITSRLLIPPYPVDSETVESLNVSMATAITIAEFRRRQF